MGRVPKQEVGRGVESEPSVEVLNIYSTVVRASSGDTIQERQRDGSMVLKGLIVGNPFSGEERTRHGSMLHGLLKPNEGMLKQDEIYHLPFISIAIEDTITEQPFPATISTRGAWHENYSQSHFLPDAFVK